MSCRLLASAQAVWGPVVRVGHPWPTKTMTGLAMIVDGERIVCVEWRVHFRSGGALAVAGANGLLSPQGSLGRPVP